MTTGRRRYLRASRSTAGGMVALQPAHGRISHGTLLVSECELCVMRRLLVPAAPASWHCSRHTNACASMYGLCSPLKRRLSSSGAGLGNQQRALPLSTKPKRCCCVVWGHSPSWHMHMKASSWHVGRAYEDFLKQFGPHNTNK